MSVHAPRSPRSRRLDACKLLCDSFKVLAITTTLNLMHWTAVQTCHNKQMQFCVCLIVVYNLLLFTNH